MRYLGILIPLLLIGITLAYIESPAHLSSTVSVTPDYVYLPNCFNVECTADTWYPYVRDGFLDCYAIDAWGNRVATIGNDTCTLCAESPALVVTGTFCPETPGTFQVRSEAWAWVDMSQYYGTQMTCSLSMDCCEYFGQQPPQCVSYESGWEVCKSADHCVRCINGYCYELIHALSYKTVNAYSAECADLFEECDGIPCCGGLTCVNGICLKVNGQSCTSHDECASGCCYNGVCSPSDYCTCVDECKEGEMGCIDARTAWFCGQADPDPCLEPVKSPCPSGTVCVNGQCVSKTKISTLAILASAGIITLAALYAARRKLVVILKKEIGKKGRR